MIARYKIHDEWWDSTLLKYFFTPIDRLGIIDEQLRRMQTLVCYTYLIGLVLIMHTNCMPQNTVSQELTYWPANQPFDKEEDCTCYKSCVALCDREFRYNYFAYDDCVFSNCEMEGCCPSHCRHAFGCSCCERRTKRYGVMVPWLSAEPTEQALFCACHCLYHFFQISISIFLIVVYILNILSFVGCFGKQKFQFMNSMPAGIHFRFIRSSLPISSIILLHGDESITKTAIPFFWE